MLQIVLFLLSALRRKAPILHERAFNKIFYNEGSKSF